MSFFIVMPGYTPLINEIIITKSNLQTADNSTGQLSKVTNPKF